MSDDTKREAKHTPGPWEAVHPEGDSNALDVYPVGNRHYKIMHGKWGGMADARLVAAAPDMYAALKALDASFAEVGCNPHSGACSTESDDGCDCWVSGVRAAIAKAEGRS